MELKQLEYFQCVARLESMTKAAEALYISQSSLSQTIARLERELGTRLFDREKGRIRLNSRGRMFLQTVNTVFFELSSVRQKLSAMQAQLHNTLSLASTGSKALIPCIQDFYDACPEAQVDFTFLSRAVILEKLRSRELDFALLDKPAEEEHIVNLDCITQPICALLRRDHPLAGRTAIALRELQSERLLINSQDFSKEDIAAMCAAAGFQPAAVTSSSDAHMNDLLIRRGHGVQLILFRDSLNLFDDPDIAAGKGEVVPIPISDEIYHTAYLAAPDTPPTETAAAFLAFIRAHFEELHQIRSIYSPQPPAASPAVC